LKYGGNTSCVTLDFPKEQFFIFDAGTGIKALSDALLAQGKTRKEYKAFISHPHWDHINALPFFAPLYIPGNEIEVLGAGHDDVTMRELISAQMDDIYFPITIKEFGARTYFRNLTEGTFEVEHVRVKTLLLAHPGHCLGYRVEYGDRSICYVTDNELFLPDSGNYDPFYVEKLSNFIRGTDALITDCTYTDAEYKTKVGWGHSCIGQVVDLAHNADVKNLYLFHHDPSQTDDDIDRKHETAVEDLAKRNSSTQCLAPSEGDSIRI
jgi:phosphoribosyl 1,2-cyclic phosphodiesterase